MQGVERSSNESPAPDHEDAITDMDGDSDTDGK